VDNFETTVDIYRSGKYCQFVQHHCGYLQIGKVLWIDTVQADGIFYIPPCRSGGCA